MLMASRPWPGCPRSVEGEAEVLFPADTKNLFAKFVLWAELQWLSRSSHGLSPPRVARSRVARLRARSARNSTTFAKNGFGAVQESFS